MEALSIRFGTTHFLYLLLDKGKARVKGKDSDPSNRIRIGEGRRPTPTNQTGHLSKLKPDPLPTAPEQWGQSLYDAEGISRGCS